MFPIRHTYLSKFLSYSAAWLLSLVFLSASAQAAVVPGTKFSSSKTQVLRAPLSSMTGDQDEVLDWRRPATEITFDLPPGDWANAISLDLRALPQGKMDADTPLRISLNNGKPVEIESQGHQFEAEITFPASRLRKVNNTLRIAFDAPAGADCLTGDHGAWVIDMARSTLALTTRTQPRDFRLSEVERRMSDPFTAPKTVGIIARGANREALEALSAQGIGLRMQTLPAFRVGKAGDLTLLVGTRKALKSRLKDEAIAQSTGAQIGVRDGRPMTLILTGDTDAQVMASVEAFTRYHLPAVRREITTPGELEMQTPFAQDGVQARGKALLTSLGDTEFDMSYRPKAVKLSFHVEDPKNASAELVLDLSRNGIAGPESRVDVTLNGRALGFTTLNRARKRVGFTVPAGVFRATKNELIITPTLEAKSAGCTEYNYEPALVLGRKSYLKIDSASTAQASLSRLAGSGSPFSGAQGQSSAVILSTRNDTDRAAALLVLARLGQSSGSGWNKAQFASDLSGVNPDRNILFIGEMGRQKSTLLSTAPRSFVEAARGAPVIAIAQTETPLSLASANARLTFALAANGQASGTLKFKASGLAGVYASPLSSNAVIGVITTSGQDSFARAVEPLTDQAHWDRLQGGVVRWNAETLMMTQTGNPALSGAAPALTLRGADDERFGGMRDTAAGLIQSLTQKFTRAAPAPSSPKPTIAPPTQQQERVAQNAPKLRARPEQIASSGAQAAPAFSAPALRGRAAPELSFSAPSQTGSAQEGWLSAFDMSDFDYGYFKANLAYKTAALRDNTARLIGGHMSRQEVRQSWNTLKADKQLWLIIMGALVILGLMFASPKSSHKYY